MKLTSLRPNIHFAKKWPQLLADMLLVAVFIVAGMLLARWIWLFFSPASPVLPVKQKQTISSQSATIIAGHWFSASTGHRIALRSNSNVDFKLMGVYAPTAAASGFAVFKMADGKQRSVLLKEKIVDGVNLIAIREESVDVGREGATQKLELAKSESKAKVSQPYRLPRK